MSSSRNLIGETLGGRYQVTEILGQGGMSAVYKAFDPNLQRVVAIKTIHSHLANDPKFVVRFQDEATAVAKLRHPNIVQVYDFNHDADFYYMVQEYVPGETLQERLRRMNQAERRMPIAEAVRYTIQLCNALEYAHQRGLIHRDIKPANIMLDVNGDAILMDFGIVKMVGGQSHTATGAVVGTALYMPPELIRGESPGPRSDMYSLGITLFEMVSGRPPFEADSAMALMMMHINDSVPDLHGLRPEVPDDLIAVIEQSLAKNPMERFTSMAEMADALKLVQNRIQTGTFGTATLPKGSGVNGQATIKDDQRTMGDQSASGMARRDDSSRPTMRVSQTPPPPRGTPPPRTTGSAGNGRPTYSTGGQRMGQSGAGGPRSGATPPPPPQYGYPPANEAFGAQAYDPDSYNYAEQAPVKSGGLSSLTKGRTPILLLLGGVGVLALLALVCGALIFLPGLRSLGQPTNAAALVVSPSTTSPVTAAPTGSQANLPSTANPNKATNTPLASAATPGVPAAVTEPPATPTSSTPSASPTPTIPAGIPYAQITGISLNDKGDYQVTYETYQFQEDLAKLHLIFYFDNQTTAEGYMYGGPRPFIKFNSKLRPRVAGQLCVEVANPDHSPRPDTGNCVPLPDVVVAAAKEDIPCRAGPQGSANQVATLKQGQISLVNGISADEAWWSIVDPEDNSLTCWVETYHTDTAGDISKVPLVNTGGAQPSSPTTSQAVMITDITIDSTGHYVVSYMVQGFTEALPGTHLHFFFDTVPADQVGINGGGNRLMFGGPTPFTGYTTADKPAQATKLCVLVANPNHSVIPNSGNCFPLPAAQSSRIVPQSYGLQLMDGKSAIN